MTKTLKVFKCEVYKTVSNRFLMAAFFVFFVLMLFVVIGYQYLFPLLSIQLHVGGFDGGFLISLAAHLIFSALMMLIARRLFKKQDL